ncbi:MAG: PAS domain S-box protein [Candidatus Anammoxibacter sp.]
MAKKEDSIQSISELTRINKELKIREKQQAALSMVGMSALSSNNFTELINKTVNCIAQVLNIEYCKVLEYIPSKNKLLLIAGVGWKKGLVGNTTVRSNEYSQAGYTLLSKGPVVVDDLRTETRFTGPKLLTDHGIVSGISVMIHNQSKPYGILGAHTTRHYAFTNNDVNFLQAMANILANAIEHRKIDESLRESRIKYQDLYENAPDMFVSVDKKTAKILQCNQMVISTLGYSRKDIIGHPVYDLYHPDCMEAAKKVFMLFAEKGEIRNTELQLMRKDGSKVDVSLNASAVRDSKGKILYSRSVWRDITERKKGEDALRKQKEITEQKNLALNEMLSQLEIEKKKITDNVTTNVENFLLPVLEKLKLNKEPNKYVELLRKNLYELISPFGVDLIKKNAKLTSRETEICNMIKNGLSSKEISNLLHIGYRTTETHRANIRKKLGVSKQSVNLELFLQTL